MKLSKLLSFDDTFGVVDAERNARVVLLNVE